ncbi:MAG: proprotein convertase P-domain-containing protein, partial [Planctomycetota bacterium]
MKLYALELALLAISLVLIVPASAARAETQTFASTDVPKVIPDDTTVTSTISVSGLRVSTTHVTVILEDIVHGSDSDLDVFLVGPTGTRVELFTGVGGSGANFIQTVLDDDATSQIVSGSAPFTGQYQPESVLGELESENPNGTWKLEITDTATGNAGTLNHWSITISAGTPMDWLTKQITDNTKDDGKHQISGSNVVWEGYDGTDYEIFLYNATTATTIQITNNSRDDLDPQIHGSNVVWKGYDGTDYEIFLYDVTTATTTKITNNNSDDEYPQLYNSNVVWHSYDESDAEIFLHDASTATTTQITDDDNYDMIPQIHGSYVVWESHDGADSEIVLYNITTAATSRITNNGYEDWYPHIHGSSVVWQGQDGSDMEIFLHDITTATTTKLTNNGNSDLYPFSYGPNVVWQRYDGSDWDILLYN